MPSVLPPTLSRIEDLIAICKDCNACQIDIHGVTDNGVYRAQVLELHLYSISIAL